MNIRTVSKQKERMTIYKWS